MSSFVRGGSSAAKVTLGLGGSLYLALPFLITYGRHLSGSGKFYGVDIAEILAVAAGGAIGSIVSIMVPIKDFAAIGDTDPAILFFTGFFKPIVGTAFALFVFAVLCAGILPVTVTPEKAPFFYGAMAFIAGFSERFATDVASHAERIASTTTSTTKSLG